MDINLNQFYNSETLNIFSDASMSKDSGCYGTCAVYMDNVVEESYRIVSHSTVNDSEAKGIRYALGLANKYKNRYKYINIFSDSQISVNALNIGMPKNWYYNPADNKMYRTNKFKKDNLVANQAIVVESYLLLCQLKQETCGRVNVFHQKGHVTFDLNSLEYARKTFALSNGIRGCIDMNLIRYIACYNNLVDDKSRKYLLANKYMNHNFRDAIEFNASILYK